MVVIAFSTGHGARQLVRDYKIDRKYGLFRFSNKWHYIFSGEVLDFPHIPGESEDVYFLILDILSDTSGQLLIYSGRYIDHTLDKEGNIENILIQYPHCKERSDDSKFKEIPSKFFLIPYSIVLNINVRYIEGKVESPKQNIDADDKHG